MKDLSIRNDMAPTVSLLYSAVEENSLRLASIVSHMTHSELYYKGRCQTKTARLSFCTISQMLISDGSGVSRKIGYRTILNRHTAR